MTICMNEFFFDNNRAIVRRRVELDVLKVPTGSLLYTVVWRCGCARGGSSVRSGGYMLEVGNAC